MRPHRVPPITKSDLFLVALFALPLCVTLARLPSFSSPALMASALSLSDLPHHLREAAKNVVFIPIGAVVVVAFRLTLGLKMLGLFRPILLALAFELIGLPLGLAFLVPVLVFIVLVRPLVDAGHNYARMAVLLSLAAALLLAPLMAGQWLDIRWLQEIAFFPVIALCLTCESFAKVADQESLGEAAWRALNTVLAAAIILAATNIGGALDYLLRFPELLLAQAGSVLLINRHLDFRLFEGVNPLIALRADVSGQASSGSRTATAGLELERPQLRG